MSLSASSCSPRTPADGSRTSSRVQSPGSPTGHETGWGEPSPPVRIVSPQSSAWYEARGLTFMKSQSYSRWNPSMASARVSGAVSSA